jgi:hypothetical protein
MSFYKIETGVYKYDTKGKDKMDPCVEAFQTTIQELHSQTLQRVHATLKDRGIHDQTIRDIMMDLHTWTKETVGITLPPPFPEAAASPSTKQPSPSHASLPVPQPMAAKQAVKKRHGNANTSSFMSMEKDAVLLT